jgi:hypothetical protein
MLQLLDLPILLVKDLLLDLATLISRLHSRLQLLNHLSQLLLNLRLLLNLIVSH